MIICVICNKKTKTPCLHYNWRTTFKPNRGHTMKVISVSEKTNAGLVDIMHIKKFEFFAGRNGCLFQKLASPYHVNNYRVRIVEPAPETSTTVNQLVYISRGTRVQKLETELRYKRVQ